MDSTKIDAVINKMLHSKIEGSRRLPELRGSQLPICEVHFLASTLIGGTVENDSFAKDFYMSIGTAIHETTQKWLARSGYLLGDWKCPVCGKIKRKKFGPQKCNCKTEMAYWELEVKDEHGLLCHFDGVLNAKGMNRIYRGSANKSKLSVEDGHYLLEIKSIGSDGLHMEKLPRSTHYAQATTYGWLAKTKLGLNIKKVVFLYMSRDHFAKYKVFTAPVNSKTYKSVIETYKKCCKRLETGDFKGPFSKTCKTLSDATFCPFKSICFHSDKQTTKHLNDLWKECKGVYTLASHTQIR